MVWLVIEDSNDPPKSFERVEYIPPHRITTEPVKVFVPMEKAGPRVYADARADSYERSETHYMYICSSGRVVPIYIRLFPRSAYVAVIYRAEDGLPPIHFAAPRGMDAASASSRAAPRRSPWASWPV